MSVSIKKLITLLITCFAALPAFAQFTFNLDKGAPATNLTTIEIEISATSATEMMISEDINFEGAKWQAYQPKFNFQLEKYEGEHYVFAKVRFANGEETATVAKKIFIDTTPPKGGFINITAGSYVTTNEGLELEIFAKEAAEMIVSNYQDFAGARWIEYQRSLPWRVTSGEGEKRIYAKFRDKAGNETKVIQETIQLDVTPPQNGSFNILVEPVVRDPYSGIKVTQQRKETLALDVFADEAKYMMISNDFNFYGARWILYKDYVDEWPLPAKKDGTYRIYVKFKDLAQNESKVYSDTLTIDTRAPYGGRMRINKGATVTNNPTVELDIRSSEAHEMMLSLDPAFGGVDWEPFQVTKSFKLPNEDGIHTIYISFRDVAGNVSKPIKSSIRLDDSPPKNGNITILSKTPYTLDDRVKVRLQAEDAMLMQFSTKPNFIDALWKRYRTSPQEITIGTELGDKIIYARFQDDVGNFSAVISDTITVANQPLLCAISLENNQRYCVEDDKRVNLELKAINAVEMQVSQSKDFTNVEWQPYSTTQSIILDGEEDGEKQIFARYKSEYGVISKPVETRVILDRSAPEGTMKINGGEFITLQSLVNVEMDAKGADFMQISLLPSLAGALWMSYRPKYTLDLGVQKGTRQIFVRFKDYAGNQTEILSDSVSYAILPVRNELVINGGAEYTNAENGRVNLSLASRNATEMIISNHADFSDSQWEAFKPQKEWQFVNADGKKRVYVKFKTATNTESKVFEDSIILDRLQPPGSIELKQIELSKRSAVLNVYPSSPNATHMQLSETPNFEGRYWEAYREGPLPLRFINRGKKIVYARFRDASGNISDVATDTAVLVIYPYAPNFEINKGARYITNKEKKVTLSIFCRDAVEMMVSNQKDFKGGTWESYTEEKEWILEGEDGEKIVYIKFRSITQTEGGHIRRRILLDRDPPSDLKILVNQGEESTFNAYVTVAVRAEGAIGMQVSVNEDFKGALWRNYSRYPFRLDIPPVGGQHTIYARFRDRNDNISEVISDDILLEIMPLETDFSIDNNSPYCNDKNGRVNLTLFARSATEMLISNNANFSRSRWQPYKEKTTWALSETDGEKEVFVKFKSHTGTESAPISKKIILDRQPPVNCDLTLERDSWTESNRIRVFPKATDAVEMQLSEDVKFVGKRWLPFSDQLNYFELSRGDGNKTVFARFKDAAGNISRIIRKPYTLDTGIPKDGKILINDGIAYTNQQEVEVTLLAEDAVEMRLSNQESKFTDKLPWRPYAVKFQGEIDDFDGTHQIFAQLKDASGNVSYVFSASIVLDTEPPLKGDFYIREGDYCKDPAKRIHLEFKVSHASQMIVANQADFSDGTWEHLKQSRTWTLDGEDGHKIVYVKFADEAGNISETIAKEIFLDITAPSGEIIANNGDKRTNEPQLNLHLDVVDASEMIVGNHPHFLGVDWQAFTSDFQWRVPATNGLKKVYAKFRDQVGNLSPTYVAEITLDMQPPVPKLVQVNISPEQGEDNLIQVEAQNIELFISAKDASFVKVANSESDLAQSEWIPFLSNGNKDWMQISWELSPLDLQAASEGRNPSWESEQVGIQGQLKTIYYQLKDNAENESTVFKKEVMLYAPKPMEVFIWKWQ